MMSQTMTLTVLAVFGMTAFITGAVHRYASNLERFLAARRSVGMFTGALSVAATWIWAPALFLAAQKAYEQGIAGLMWFTLPNVGCLILFAFLAVRIRRFFPRGYTFPQYIASRFDIKTHAVYVFTFLSLQICSLGVQLIAGAAMLNAMSGVPSIFGVIILAVIFTSYSLVDGLASSIRTDLLQMFFIGAGMIILIPFAVFKGGGIQNLTAGLGGVSGEFSSPFNAHAAYSFGITVTIGLMSGPIGDQQHWQRAFAFQESMVFKGYILGAMIFAIVPLSMSLLGFTAAGNPQAAPLVYQGIISAQQTGPEVIRTLLPPWAMFVFMVMILSGLSSTGDSALCAGSSLAAIDIYRRYIKPDASDQEILKITRIAILVISITAAAISLIPGITILGLFLFYGTLRSSTLMPTILILYKKNIPAWGIFWGIVVAVIIGLPLYLTGEILGNIHLKVGANIGIILISFLLPVLSINLNKKGVLNEMSKLPE
ncbi:Na+/solute symporter family protein [Desulfonema limicola]|uniref:Na+/solute symporter family protein n=1 Tax=Desulfonema limicola TaxID=45656 RepID=A0A975B409_9BACT|nr:hypothetical protein [Desulfonema limicola]QTA78378.1 Na+/solute symporter family protein [Desulfonema limicola]